MERAVFVTSINLGIFARARANLLPASKLGAQSLPLCPGQNTLQANLQTASSVGHLVASGALGMSGPATQSRRENNRLVPFVIRIAEREKTSTFPRAKIAKEKTKLHHLIGTTGLPSSRPGLAISVAVFFNQSILCLFTAIFPVERGWYQGRGSDSSHSLAAASNHWQCPSSHEQAC